MTDSQEHKLEAMLTDLQAEIHRHRSTLQDLSGPAARDPLQRVREKQRVNPHLPIGWPDMPRGILPKLTAYAQKVTRHLLRWYINPIVAQQNEFNAALTEYLITLDATSQRAQQILEQLEKRAQQIQVRLEEKNEATSLRLQRLENWHRGTPEPAGAPETHERPASQESRAPIDYFLLGAFFRNRLQMDDRLHDYDDLFSQVAEKARREGTPLLPVLDIGAGRGDYVAHLLSLGVPGYGIDLDADALSIGQANGLDLRQVDAITHLQQLPDQGLAAIVMMQVIEHLHPEALLSLLQLALQKLEPGGFVVAETINPACLYALSNWYLMDPSHRMPVHSETTRFLMMQAGFHRIEVRFLHPVSEAERLQSIVPFSGDCEPGAVALVQRNFEQLNHILYGPQDYAAIAYKPEA